MNCPRCSNYINVEPDEITDSPTGLLVSLAWRFDDHVRTCRCGWSFTVQSSIGPHNRRGAMVA